LQPRQQRLQQGVDLGVGSGRCRVS
jgi:hypothetical protein